MFDQKLVTDPLILDLIGPAALPLNSFYDYDRYKPFVLGFDTKK